MAHSGQVFCYCFSSCRDAPVYVYPRLLGCNQSEIPLWLLCSFFCFSPPLFSRSLFAQTNQQAHGDDALHKHTKKKRQQRQTGRNVSSLHRYIVCTVIGVARCARAVCGALWRLCDCAGVCLLCQWKKMNVSSRATGATLLRPVVPERCTQRSGKLPHWGLQRLFSKSVPLVL